MERTVIDLLLRNPACLAVKRKMEAVLGSLEKGKGRAVGEAEEEGEEE